jgi:RNA polymerase sigma factor (sigma-70 family)
VLAPEFEALYRGQFAGIVRLAALLGAEDPEDVAQEAFVRLHHRWAQVERSGAELAYLRRIAINLTRSRHRRRTAATRVRWLRAVDDDTAPSAEDAVVLSERQRLLLAAVDGLSPRHREALLLRFWLQLSEREMAQAMGTVSRGLAALRAALAEQEALDR